MPDEVIIIASPEEAAPPAVVESEVSEPLLDHEGRIATLEERLSECQRTLQLLNERSEAATAQAEAATALALEAESLALEAALPEPPTEEPEASELTEIPSEPEPENGGDQEKSTKWWESILTLR